MKVRYPLSLKISLWLLLNLLLLAGVGLAVVVSLGGLGWTALVAGPIGERAQLKVNIVAAELAAATPENRADVIQRFSTAYGASLATVRMEDLSIAVGRVTLPAELITRLEANRPTRRPPGHGNRPDLETPPEEEPGPAGLRIPHRDKGDRRPLAGPGREGLPPPARPDLPPDRRRQPPDLALANVEPRLLLRAGEPAAYWAAFRLPQGNQDRGRPGPVMIVARLDSFWSLLRFLELESWLLAGTGVLAVSVLFWLPLVHGMTRALRQLTAATERIAEGRFDTRVSVGRNDELGLLGDSVNRMATRLDTQLTGQKRFLGDVAHELCSPLARLQLASGILGDQAPASLQETVADVRDEVQQMSALVNELLDFTKAGLRPRDVACEPRELAPIVAAAIDREGTAARTTLDLPAGLRAAAEAGLLGRAVGNLLRNAARYAGPDSPIRVQARREGSQVILVIEDEGPGVPPAALDRLGEPFFRPEAARTREAGGVGLGLAIVRQSIAALGGDVRFSNRSPHGFRAEIRLAAA